MRVPFDLREEKHKDMKGETDTILVSITRPKKGKTILVVGRKLPSQAVNIVNAFSGNDAEELYQKLITKKNKGDSK